VDCWRASADRLGVGGIVHRMSPEVRLVSPQRLRGRPPGNLRDRANAHRCDYPPIAGGRHPFLVYGRDRLFRSRAALQTENLVLRHQLNVLRRRAPKRVVVSNLDRLVFTGLYRLAPKVLDAVKILKAETVIRGIAPAFEPGGAGNQGYAAVDQRHLMRFAI
jgi:hypothetical protein